MQETNLPIIYLNLVGGQDDLVFDGGSFVLDSRGANVCQFPQFAEKTEQVIFEERKRRVGAIVGFFNKDRFKFMPRL